MNTWRSSGAAARLLALAALPFAAGLLVARGHRAAVLFWWALSSLVILLAAGLRRRRAETLLLLGAVAVTLGLAEAALRLLYPPALRPVEKLPSPRYHHVHRPGSVMYQGSYEGREIVVRTNEDGFRSRHGRAEFLRHGRRIAVLGDSFTFGVGVTQEEPFPQVLERLLAAGRPGEVAVLNAGTISWSPIIAVRVYRGILREYRPTDVLYVLDATDIGDDFNYARELEAAPGGEPLFRVPAPRGAPYYGALAQVAGPERLREMLGAPLRLVAAGTGGPPAVGTAYDWYDFRLEVDGVMETNRFFIYRHPLEATRPWFDATWNHIRELARLVEEDGAAFTLVILPRFQHWNAAECPENWEAGQYRLDEPWQNEMFRYFRERRAEAAFPVLDLLPDFQATDRFPLTFRIDPHLNADGHAFVAGLLADHLEPGRRAEGYAPAR